MLCAVRDGPDFTFADLFAGIGGFRLALESLGGKCVFSSEWDKFSQRTYEANFGDAPAGDIRSIDARDIPSHDILAAGFPCQPFSIAGVTKKNSLGMAHGFKDKNQGNLFFDIARVIKAKRPRAFILENVKNLVGHDRGRTFKVIMRELTRLGYAVSWEILDAKYYVPQHRERIFIVGFDASVFKDIAYDFPDPPARRPRLADILEKEVDRKYTLTDHLWEYLRAYAAKHRKRGNGFSYGLFDPAVAVETRTLSARYYKDGAEVLVKQTGSNPRRLTPRECARLMGFPDDFRIVVSDVQAYRQFGNSLVVPLARDVARDVVKIVAPGFVRSHFRDRKTSQSLLQVTGYTVADFGPSADGPKTDVCGSQFSVNFSKAARPPPEPEHLSR